MKMSPILRTGIGVFKLFGYFALSFGENARRRRFVERLLIAWTLCWLSAYSSVTCYTLTFSKDFLFVEDAFGYFNDTLKLLIAELAIFVAYLESLLRRKAMRNFWLLHESLNSNSIDQCWPTRLPSWHTHTHFLAPVGIMIAIEVIALILFLWLQDFTELNTKRFWMMFMPFIYVIHIRNAQFIFHIAIIRLELVKLKHDLHLFADYTHFARRVTAFVGFEQFVRRKLVQKQLAYQRIHEMFDNFQQAFGLSIVAVMLMVYVRILVDSYFTYYSFYIGHWQAESLLLLPAFAQIPAFLFTSKSCMDVVKHITFQLHNIERQSNTGTLSVQIQNFSLQIMHQKIRIDAVGITTMDTYMLTRIAGSLTTYMIFFIQFMPKFGY